MAHRGRPAHAGQSSPHLGHLLRPAVDWNPHSVERSRRRTGADDALHEVSRERTPVPTGVRQANRTGASPAGGDGHGCARFDALRRFDNSSLVAPRGTGACGWTRRDGQHPATPTSTGYNDRDGRPPAEAPVMPTPSAPRRDRRARHGLRPRRRAAVRPRLQRRGRRGLLVQGRQRRRQDHPAAGAGGTARRRDRRMRLRRGRRRGPPAVAYLGHLPD